MPPNQKRQTAHIISIKALLSGTYKVEEGWQPNYVLLPDGRQVSRVNLVGIVIAREEGSGEFLLDDGSSTVVVRSFEDTAIPAEVKVGDPVLLVGRPRLFGKDIYVFPEIIRRLENPGWIRFRKRELEILEKDMPEKEAVPQGPVPASPLVSAGETTTAPQESGEEADEETPAEKIMTLVREMDKGEGAATEEVINRYNQEQGSTEGEALLNDLLKRGQLFEIKGKLKVLE
ncbi:MAG: hypothetical protein GXP63_00930 [DPANN group archaeon]|nr:hypothetical protein [DPANN group archaeon]